MLAMRILNFFERKCDWPIGMDCEKESKETVLLVHLDDDDDKWEEEEH